LALSVIPSGVEGSLTILFLKKLEISRLRSPFGGKYLSTDHPSGRIIKFPKSKVLSVMVFNYSWPLFPYIWNEIKFYIAYNTDLEFVSRTMQKITEEEIGEEMMERVAIFRTRASRSYSRGRWPRPDLSGKWNLPPAPSITCA
jgi:small-conductance mechanosensitive channel